MNIAIPSKHTALVQRAQAQSLRIASSIAILVICICSSAVSWSQERWTVEQAKKWQEERGWLVGANYLPAYAINQLEMWQIGTYDPERIDKELGWAQSLGFNSMRVFLHDLLWTGDGKDLTERMDQFLAISAKHKIGIVFVPFDSVWDPQPVAGKQRDPKRGVHNSGWVQSPGASILGDPAKHVMMKPYLQGILRRFKDDPRIQAWDLVNELDNDNANSYGRNGTKTELPNKAEMGTLFAKRCFEWAREVNPSQPLTCGVWIGLWEDESKLSPMEKLCLEQSDIITFHNYGDGESLKRAVKSLSRYDRPILCTEYMARGNNSLFDPNLQVLKDLNVGAHNWGFVDGKSQTIYPWDSWQKPYDKEPELWFHDIFRRDGTPYRESEVEYIRGVVIGKKKK
jgi:GH35 family endo-1,4-beta-xylanase